MDLSSSEAAVVLEEAAKKSSVLWISLPGVDQPRAAWHVWQDGSIYVVTGGIEQPLPGLTNADQVTVTLRSKDNGARLLEFPAAVAVVPPGSTEWEAVTPTLHANRLNAPDGENQPRRWAGQSQVVRLTPVSPDQSGSR